MSVSTAKLHRERAYHTAETEIGPKNFSPPVIKRLFSDFLGKDERPSRSLIGKKIRKFTSLSDFSKCEKSTPETEAITERLFPLLRNPENESRLQATVNYIEARKSILTEIAQNKAEKSLYIHPDKALSPPPFHIEICAREDGLHKIYILPKLHFLGKGSTKKVFKAIDYTDENTVACSTTWLKDDKTMRRALHEFAVQKLFSQADDFSLYFNKNGCGKAHIFMPYGNFGSLEKAISPEGHTLFFKTFNPSERLEIFRQILAMIGKFHAENYVIADIKPENIIVHKDEEKLSVMLPDLGTAYVENDRKASRYVGSPRYMGPEFLENNSEKEQVKNIGRPTDIYALGLMLWELFVGGTPPWMINIPLKAVWLEPNAYRKAYFDSYSYEEDCLENLIYRMTHPDPYKRPSIQAIIAQSPNLEVSSPAYEGTRLLTIEESFSRHEANRCKVDDIIPENKCYTLVRGKKQDHFYVHTENGLKKIKPLEDGKIRAYKEPKKYKIYVSLEAYLKNRGLLYCLNWDASD